MAYLQAYEQGLRPVLDAVGDVTRILGKQSLGIELPKIAVIGDQSSGKSSLLESIFGVALPRGEDIVTRTPIQVEHRYVAAKENARAEVSYRKSPDTEYRTLKVEGLDGIEQAVRQTTNDVAGEGKDVVDNTIFLRIYSPLLPDLTVLDLPGITRNALEGQAENIEEIVTQLIDNNIKGNMTVLLCVVQANVDFSTAAAIKLAKKHDPERDRTMGVVTKIDLMEAGADIIARLEGSGHNLKLKLGFIPVRNRTTEELRKGTPLTEVRANEEKFFKQRLPQLPKERRGIAALVSLVAEVQRGLIEKSLPELKKQVHDALVENKNKLRRMETRVVSSESGAHLKAHSIMAELRTAFARLRQGDYLELRGADSDAMKVARRVFEMATAYKEEVEQLCNLSWFLGQECFAELKEKSKDLRGAALPNFLSHPVFVVLFRERVQSMLLEPALTLVTQVRSYIEAVLAALIDDIAGPFPKFGLFSKDQLLTLLFEQEQAARDHVELIVRQQQIVMTLNHYYMTTVNNIKSKALEMKTMMERAGYAQQYCSSSTATAEAQKLAGEISKLTAELGQEQFDALMKMAECKDNEDLGLIEMQISLSAYGKVVLKRVYDDVALGVRQLLVDDVGEKLEQYIQRGLSEAAGASRPAPTSNGNEGVATSAATGGVLSLMQDPAQARQKEALARIVGDLEKAWSRLKHVSM